MKAPPRAELSIPQTWDATRTDLRRKLQKRRAVKGRKGSEECSVAGGSGDVTGDPSKSSAAKVRLTFIRVEGFNYPSQLHSLHLSREVPSGLNPEAESEGRE